jgi:UDP-glucuronate 4-epimerase
LGGTYFDLHGVPVVSLRLFSVYGPRLRPDLAMAIFTQKILAGQRLPLYGDGTIRRDFTHVHDICTGLLSAMTADGVAGESLNLGHDEPIEVRRLIEMLEHEIGKPALIDRQASSPGDLPLTHADLSKSRRLLRYQPQTSFEEGLKEYVAWFRRHQGTEAVS